jgi:nucleotide-binding universal stress UspA family protein
VLKRITVAVDGSPASELPLGHAIEQARQNNAVLTGIFVIDGQWADFIGNDWQSSKGARQGFLDYILQEQESQAQLAQDQFRQAAADWPQASFEVLAGDPIGKLLELANIDSTDLLITSRRVFQVSGRPSLKTLGSQLAKRASCPLLLLP